MNLLADVAVRSSLILLGGLMVTALLRHRPAALRHLVLAAALFGAAAVAPLVAILPAWDVLLPAAATVALQSAPEPDATVQTVQPTEAGGPHRISLGALLVAIWLSGVVIGGAMLLSGFRRLMRIAARAERVHDPRWTRVVDEIAAAYGLRRAVLLLQTDAPDLLATYGLFRPRVLLPSHARNWTDERLRVVLCHELAHIRRHDWLVQISAEALRTLYWFNPLQWVVCTRLRRESEQACDDAVLGIGVAAPEYATHLLELARMSRGPGRPWASATPIARPSTLRRRIAAMLNADLNRRPLSRRTVALTIGLVVAVALPAAALRAAQSTALPLTGSVYDASGAVLPVVGLSLHDTRELTWQATTDATGHFEFPAVLPGRYVLEATLAGFRPLRHEFELRNARDWDRAITLQVGDVRESIAVRASRVAGPTSSSTPPGAEPLRVGGNIRAPRKQKDVHPVYPATMRAAGREGVVPLEAIIGRDGAVHSVRVLSAQVHPDFAAAAMDAVRQWYFDPTLLNGVPVEVVMTVSVAFSLAD
jgi:TonB family protein